MAKFRFTATHAVHFSDDGVKAWAHFQRDTSADNTREGVPGYSFETDSAAVAKRLRAVTDYGITEDAPAGGDTDADTDGDEAGDAAGDGE